MALITEDHLEQQCLEWFQDIGYSYVFAPQLDSDGCARPCITSTQASPPPPSMRRRRSQPHRPEAFELLHRPLNPAEKVFEAYAQNRTPGAYRVFWCYGPQQGQIIIVAITPHP